MTSQAPHQIVTVIGRNIASARAMAKPKPLTQRQLAIRLNLDTRAVGRWETGGIIPSAKNLAALAQELKRDPGWFYSTHPDIDYEQKAAA